MAERSEAKSEASRRKSKFKIIRREASFDAFRFASLSHFSEILVNKLLATLPARIKIRKSK